MLHQPQPSTSPTQRLKLGRSKGPAWQRSQCNWPSTRMKPSWRSKRRTSTTNKEQRITGATTAQNVHKVNLKLRTTWSTLRNIYQKITEWIANASCISGFKRLNQGLGLYQPFSELHPQLPWNDSRLEFGETQDTCLRIYILDTYLDLPSV